MGAYLTILVASLLFTAGCVTNTCSQTPYVECADVISSSPSVVQDCQLVDVSYSWKEMVVKEEFSWEVGRYLTTNVEIRNNDSNLSGEWNVQFLFTTLDDGATTKDVKYALPPGEGKDFSTTYDLAFGEDYKVEYKITPPKKETCASVVKYVKKTTRQCSDEVKYREICP